MQILGPSFVLFSTLDEWHFFRGKIFPNLFPLLFQAKKMSVVGTKDAQQLNPYSFGCSIMTHQLQH